MTPIHQDLGRFFTLCLSLIACCNYTYSILFQGSLDFWILLLFPAFFIFAVLIATEDYYKIYLALGSLSIFAASLEIVILHTVSLYFSIPLFFSLSFLSFALAVEDASLRIFADILYQEYVKDGKRNLQEQVKIDFFRLPVEQLESAIYAQTNNYLQNNIPENNIGLFFTEEIERENKKWKITKYKTDRDEYYTLKVRKNEEKLI